MTSKPSITNCPKLSLACSYFPSFCGVCGIVVNDTFHVFPACFFPAQLVFAGVNPLRLRPVVFRPLFMWDTRSPDGNQRYIPGGYCGGVPPLPIPNREVKPACADGTAMQCGRVGGRLLSSWRASGTEVPQALLLVFMSFTSLRVNKFTSLQVDTTPLNGNGYS